KREQEQIGDWASIYESLYREETREHEEEDDFRGWTSSYDSEAISIPDMQEWRNAAVQRILETESQRILELGVGSGLLLWKIAPRCWEYWGADFSRSAIETLKAKIERDERLRGKVRLHVQTADRVDVFEENYFDAIVLNSVVQYFPSEKYLQKIIQNAM